MKDIEKFDSDNLIYNRYDLIHAGEFCRHVYLYGSSNYEVMSHVADGVAEINVWGKSLPENIFFKAISDIFSDSGVYAIRITRGRSGYYDFLESTNDIRVPLPGSIDELLNRAERRDRATIRRKLRWLDERVGRTSIEVYERKNIPEDIVKTYFDWKKETHGTDYGLSEVEYLDKYYVTDAMIMKAGEESIAVAFFCQVKDIVFFENFSYNTVFKEYSPGLLMYVKLMEELINRGCRYLYLGGGSYIYKKRFGAEANDAYSGIIYRQEIVDSLNLFLKKKNVYCVAFYGYGVAGHAFVQLSKNLNIKVSYGIDKNNTAEGDVVILSPDDDLPRTDAVFITMNNRNEEVETFLHRYFNRVVYWNDVLSEVIMRYRREVNESIKDQ